MNHNSVQAGHFSWRCLAFAINDPPVANDDAGSRLGRHRFRPRLALLSTFSLQWGQRLSDRPWQAVTPDRQTAVKTVLLTRPAEA